jgi:N-acyl-D-aspartate/D-glutamate deacylase
MVLDGSRADAAPGDVGIRGDRIAGFGDLSDASGAIELDLTGLYLAPGFIDAHSHGGPGLADPEASPAVALLAQGITTAFINPDGGGPVDMAEQREALLEHGIGVNAAQLVPHGSVREEVLGMADRAPSAAELEQMRSLVRAGMEEGAFGLSSGPFYAPGSFSETSELIELARVAAEFGGVYTSHIRDESDYTIGLEASVAEVIEVAEGAGLTGIVTHIKALGPRVWGFSATIVEMIETARARGVSVFADQYSYDASSTGLSSALLPRWAQAGGADSLQARLADPETLALIREEMVENLDRRGGADRIQIRDYDPNPTWAAWFLSDFAEEWNVDPIEAAIRILRQTSPAITSFNMNEEDIRRYMVQPWTMTSTDGSLPRFGEGLPHPRSYGTFARKIRRYVLDEGVLDLPTAIRSMTSLPAEVLGVQDRGSIRVDAFADLVVFDLDRVRDVATYEEPHQLSEGMVHVLVNGEFAIRDGAPTQITAGRVLTR